MNMNRLSVFTLAVSLTVSAVASPAQAAPAKAERLPPEKACMISPVTWVREDRLPPVIRSAPSYHAPIIGKILPEQIEGEDEPRPIDLIVDRVAGDFVHVEAREAVPDSGLAATPAGWIQQDGIYFTMQTAAGFSRPSEKSREVYATDDWIYRSSIVRIVECRDEWVKLVVANNEDYNPDAEVNPHWTFTTAWFRGFCGVAETTCDGVKGDNPKGLK